VGLEIERRCRDSNTESSLRPSLRAARAESGTPGHRARARQRVDYWHSVCPCVLVRGARSPPHRGTHGSRNMTAATTTDASAATPTRPDLMEITAAAAMDVEPLRRPARWRIRAAVLPPWSWAAVSGRPRRRSWTRRPQYPFMAKPEPSRCRPETRRRSSRYSCSPSELLRHGVVSTTKWSGAPD
jgi:hypothetical protein